MSLSNLTSRDAVLAAIAEYDAIGRDEFLARHGFGQATRYLLEHNGRRYDSKAIAGVAHGIEHPDLGPLRSEDFSGGASTVKPALEILGFRVIDAANARTPKHWALCANPKRYRVRDAIAHVEIDLWLAERGDLRAGDTVAIWQTLDSDGHRGIVGFGEVLKDPSTLRDTDNPYWVVPEEGGDARLRVPIRYTRIPQPLWLDDTSNGLFISTLSVARARGGSIFLLTEAEWVRLRELAGSLPTIDDAVADVESEIRRPGRAGTGQGFGLSVPKRQVLERYAMQMARAYFSTRWQEVLDVSARCSFDLLCRSGAEELRVEVKGTTTSGDQIVLTRREVAEAETPGYVLFVVSEVLIEEIAGEIRASGGTARMIDAWSRGHHTLEPIAFRVALDWKRGIVVEPPPSTALSSTAPATPDLSIPA